jgi:hypothetical protein
MGDQPLSVVSLENNKDRSVNLPLYPIDIHICWDCTHVFNSAFDPNKVQYNSHGCRMFNNGSGWKEHLDSLRNEIETQYPDIVIEIGAGDCSFLSTIKSEHRIAIDPCEAVEEASKYGISYKRELFDAAKHIPKTPGNITILMRHLLEHVDNPRDFIGDIVKAAESRAVLAEGSTVTKLLVEVPCCDNAIKRTRIEDWTYEHPQHFTTKSMAALFRNTGVKHFFIGTSYNEEVVVAYATITPSYKSFDLHEITDDYNKASVNIVYVGDWIRRNLNMIAFWGGAGKSAMFLRKFGVPSCALVVDSHEAKHGFYVPGTGIEIKNPDELKFQDEKYIIATTSWRANDIRDEILKRGIPCKGLFKFEDGNLKEVSFGY